MFAAAPLYLEYYECLRRFDRTGAMALVEAFLAQGGTVDSLYDDVLAPAMIYSGGEWEANRITVAHEHYISETTADVVRRVGPRLWSGTPPLGPRALACCATGERHTLGLLMAGDVLRVGGLEVYMLGESAPIEDVCAFAVEIEAQVLCLSCTLTVHLPDAADLIEQARAARPGLVVLVGGQAFQSGRGASALGADLYAAHLRDLRPLLPGLRARLDPPRAPKTVP